MTMKALIEPAVRSAKQMRAVVFTALQSGQRAKHENELRKLGFEVDSRDFPRTYSLDAYEVVFVVKDHADEGDKGRAEEAAKRAGKPWFRITKKVSNPTWDAVRDWAQKQDLGPVPDADSHPPSFAGRAFATAFADHLEKRVEAGEWEELAKEYEQNAMAAAAQTKEALAKYEAAEAEVKELRRRLQQSSEDGNSTAAQREAYRRDLALAKGEADRLSKEIVALRDANKAIIIDRDDAVKARSQMRRDYDRLIEQRDGLTQSVRRLQEEVKTAREELQELREDNDDDDENELRVALLDNEELKKKLHSKENMLTLARKERDDAKSLVTGLQDEVERLNKAMAEGARKYGTPGAPAGKRLVPANIVATVERLWALVGDGVLEADEAVEKIVAQLKGE